MDKFQKLCGEMGGEYSEEEGLLEPDVGGDRLHEWEAKKQWCTFDKFYAGYDRRDMMPKITVFRAPKVVDIQQSFIRANDDLSFPGFDTFFEEDLNPKIMPAWMVNKDEKSMCFRSTLPGFSKTVPGLTGVCISTDPQKKVIRFSIPNWGERK